MWQSDICCDGMHYVGYFPRIVETVHTSAVKSWALVLLSFSLTSAGLLAICFTLTLISAHRGLDNGLTQVFSISNDVTVSAGLLVACVVFFVAALMALLRSHEKRTFLIPHMVLEAVYCGVLFVFTVRSMYLGGVSAGGTVLVIFGLNLGTVVSVWQYYILLGKPLPQPTLSHPETIILQPLQPVQIQYVGYTQLPVQVPTVAPQGMFQLASDAPPPYAETTVPVTGGYAYFRKQGP